MEIDAISNHLLVHSSRSSFDNSFDNITQHTNVLLKWSSNTTDYYPLVIRTRVLNRTGNRGVNAIEEDIATGLMNDSFLWEDLPSPLPFIPTATYELRVLRQEQAEDAISGLAVASSQPFAILAQDRYDDNQQTATNETKDDSSEPTNPVHLDEGPNNNSTAIAAGLVVPVVLGVSVSVFLWMRQRRKRVQAVRRKERAELVID
ncbi:hypothetical protein F4808DRAFT_14838 [Astrocystis sublimbata]|nr:hypothetical protein F4808DRAFT_14838 [Astrocystis sublimbata]